MYEPFHQLGNVTRGFVELFGRAFRAKFVEICGDSDLCLKPVHKLCGVLRRFAENLGKSKNPQVQHMFLFFRRVKFPAAERAASENRDKRRAPGAVGFGVRFRLTLAGRALRIPQCFWSRLRARS